MEVASRSGSTESGHRRPAAEVPDMQSMPRHRCHGRGPARSIGAARPDRRLRRADQAADHRTAADHHHPGDVRRPARGPAADAGAGHPGRRDPGRRQRQRAELRGRRRHRRRDAPDQVAPAGQARRDAACGADLRDRARHPGRGRAVADHHLAGRGAGGRRNPVLRLRLLDVAQAPHLAEHRLGRPGRVHAGDHRLVRRDRRPSVGRPGCSSE